MYKGVDVNNDTKQQGACNGFLTARACFSKGWILRNLFCRSKSQQPPIRTSHAGFHQFLFPLFSLAS